MQTGQNPAKAGAVRAIAALDPFLDMRSSQRQSLVQEIQFLQPQEQWEVAVHECGSSTRFQERFELLAVIIAHVAAHRERLEVLTV